MIVRADARALPLRDGCVQCVVTSPPYWGLRDYGAVDQIGSEGTPDAYVANLVLVFAELRRVLVDDGTVWLNLGDSFKNKQLIGLPWRVAFALQAEGWYLRSEIIWAKPAPMLESVTDRPTKAHEQLFLLAKTEQYHYDAAAIAEASEGPLQGARPFGGMSAARKNTDRKDYLYRGDTGTRNKRSVWTINPQPFSGAHFATMPEALVEPCILTGCPVGGLVCDPFVGSGTVGAVAERLGRRWVGTDLSYQPLASVRTAQRGLRW